MTLKQLSIISIATTVALAGCSAEVGQEVTDEGDVGVAESALLINTNQTGTNNGYYFQFWKDGGNVTMDLLAGGQYQVNWQSGTYDFVGGKGWNPGSMRTVNYNAGIWSPGTSNTFLTVYGWLQNPLIEYYIVDSWGSWRPIQGTFQGTVYCDGSNYDVYKNQRVNAPSIEGTRTFDQWWSVRQAKRATGSNAAVNSSCHINYWKTKGMTLGTWNLMIMATEVYNPTSSGTSNLTVW
jgi:endo-1,4-beta-xylanase